MTAASAALAFEDLLADIRGRLARARGVETVPDVEVRRTLNELNAELRAGRSLERAWALAARPVDDLGPEDPPVDGAPLPKPRPVLVSAYVSEEERLERQRAMFEERRRKAVAARPAPKPLPPKAPVKPKPDPSRVERGDAILELLRDGPRSAYDIAMRLADDPSPHDVGAALWMLHARRLVEHHGRGRLVFWRLTRRDNAKGQPS